MKKWIKRSIKTTIITIVSLIGVIIIGGGVAIYIALTPKRLTPLVESLASSYLDAKLHFNEVELTVFKTFPKVGIRLKDGLLQSIHADGKATTDTIVSFSSVDLLFSPLDFLRYDKISISSVILENPRIYAYVDSVGKPNWDVFIISDTTTSDTTKFKLNANLEKFKLNNGKVTYDDRQSHIFGRVKRVDVNLSGKVDDNSKVLLDMKIDTALFWQEGAVLARRMNIDIKVDAYNDAAIKTLFVKDMSLKVNNLDVNLNGTVNRDSLSLNVIAKSESIDRVLDMVPIKFLDSKNKIHVKGNFFADLKCHWTYKEMPTLKGQFKLNDAGFQYDGLKYGVDDLDFDVLADIDLSNQTESNIDLKSFHVEGTALKVDLSGRVDDLFRNPRFNLHAGMDFDFVTLSETLPFGDSVELAGAASFYGDIKANLKDITDIKWYNFNATGRVTMNNVILVDLRKNFSFINTFSDLNLSTSPEGKTLLAGQLGDVSIFRKDRYDLRLKESTVDLQLVSVKDSISGFIGEVDYKALSVSLPQDSVIFTSSASTMNVDLSEWLKMRFKADTVGVDMMRSKAVLDSAFIDARVSLKGRRRMGGMVEFRDLSVMSEYFPLPVKIGRTKLSLKRDVIDLSKVKITVGNSDFEISGTAEGVFKAQRSDSVMKIKGVLRSSNIDVDELIFASNNLPFMRDEVVEESSKYTFIDSTWQGFAPTDSTDLTRWTPIVDSAELAKLEQLADSTNTEQISIKPKTKSPTATVPANLVEKPTDSSSYSFPLFIIPKNIDANFTIAVDTFKFDNYRFYNSRGGVQVADQNMRIRRVVTTFEGSQLALRAFYNTFNADSVDLTFSVDAKNIDVKKVTTLFPYLDSLTPIIRSVHGLVDFDFVAKTDFYKYLNVDMAKLDASVMITAQKIEVPDNETLASIAKMLMFKNKKVTKVDSVSMQMLVAKGEVDILPFILDIDRYRVAAGGKQSFAGDMDYHVSVLKSPIPIKFGVNIKGDFEDFKIGVGKTQFKYLQEEKYKGYINPDYTTKRDRLFKPLVVQRRKN